MNKPKKKNTQFNKDIIKSLQEKYGFKPNYIRMSIKGERVGTIPKRIKEDYETLYAATKETIETKLNNL